MIIKNLGKLNIPLDKEFDALQKLNKHLFKNNNFIKFFKRQNLVQIKKKQQMFRKQKLYA